MMVLGARGDEIEIRRLWNESKNLYQSSTKNGSKLMSKQIIDDDNKAY